MRVSLVRQLGSVVLLQSLWCNEHYFWMMTPWVHYVPVATRMEDLVETVRWLRDHDDVAQRIGAAGQAFARAHLSRRSLLLYHKELLRQYAAKLDSSSEAMGWPRGGCPANARPLPRGTFGHDGVGQGRVRYCNRAPRA